jgi:hypothetical protein
VTTLNLRRDNVPEQLRGLIPLAQRWGVQEDVCRWDAVEAATVEQLSVLASCFGQLGAANKTMEPTR